MQRGIELLVLSLGLLWPAHGQLTTGTVEGTVWDVNHRAQAGLRIMVNGRPRFHTALETREDGTFFAVLPYGEYLFSTLGQNRGIVVAIPALQRVPLNFEIDSAGNLRNLAVTQPPRRDRPGATTLTALLLMLDPAGVTQPLDFTGLNDAWVGVESQRGYSWTDTQYRLMGIDATDSYQPGRPVIVPDLQAVDEVSVRSGFAQNNSPSYGTEVGIFLGQPGSSWHGAFSTLDTGAFLSSTNLPGSADRGLIQQADRFRWFTRDGIQAGGPVTHWFDLYAMGTAQWFEQTVPLAGPGTNQRGRLLFGDLRGRIQASPRDQVDALYSGSRINLNNWAVPEGLEILASRRMSPSFDLPGGFEGNNGVDHFDFLQAGWTHRFRAVTLGVLELRYGDSTAHYSTDPPPAAFGAQEPKIELLTGVVTGAPPISDLSVRTRQAVEGAWLPQVFHSHSSRHQIVTGAGWNTSEPLNRMTIPSDINLLTLNGAPSEVVEFNTPFDSRSIIRSFETYATDQVALPAGFSLDLGILADFSRGSLPAQSKGDGQFVHPMQFLAEPDLIVWNNVSPRAGFAWKVPGIDRVVLRGSYFRIDSPMAGRYLDFGNPNSLSGSVYQWVDSDANGQFELGEEGALLMRFGGEYSSMSPSLRRPYADEYNVGGNFSLPRHSVASLQFFRRDDKQRLAVIDTGVPASAFTPITILDPGPDGMGGTSDDQHLVVYEQNPATLGQDHYLLTNPPDLRSFSTGFIARAGGAWRAFQAQLSFVDEKTYGPTNPGNAVFENDAGLVGALFMDPNTLVGAFRRGFTDRPRIAKIQASYQLPAHWSGIQLESIFAYLSGLAFTRQLLVTGLSQGPFYVAAENDQAQYVADWNLRIVRSVHILRRTFKTAVDILNVTNAGHRIQEEDITGPLFNLPVAIQEPRLIRLGIEYQF